MLICSIYITMFNQFKPWNISAVVGSVVVVGGMTCDLKAVQMSM